MKFNFYLSVFLTVLFSYNLFSQELDLQKIMSGNEYIGQQPELGIWTDNSDGYIFEWNTSDAYKTYHKFDLKNHEVAELPIAPELAFALESFHYSKNKKHAYKVHSNQLIKKTNKGNKSVLTFYESLQILEVNDLGEVLLKIGDNYFKYHSDRGALSQLTDFVKSTKTNKKEEKKTPLEKQQVELFEYIRDQHSNNQSRGDFYSELNQDHSSKIYLNDKDLSWISFAESFIVYEVSNYPKNTRTQYANFINESGYTQPKNARAKVGASNPEHDLYWKSTTSDSIKKVDISHLSGILEHPEFLNETNKMDKPKAVVFHEHGFNDDHSLLLIEIKSYDNKDRWICTLDANGSLHEIDHQHDRAWIGGPGISGWNMVAGNVGWVSNDMCYFQSEKTGYSHLYLHDCGIKKTTALTEDKFEIHEAWLNNNHSSFFIIANKKHPGNREFYQLNIQSGKWTGILTQDGNHQVSVSPDEKKVMVRYSFKNKPWELYIADIKENAEMKQITYSQTQEFKNYTWRSPEVITYQATDNTDIYARVYEPDSSVMNGAAVIFVHGAGYLQNAHNWWSGYYREYMFNNLLCDKGYTVLDIDYRASKGYGRDFRTGIYRYMGGKDLSDQMDGRQLLINNYGIDEDRIGMYGGSYGGFITLMALLTEPGKFKCGAALRSVTDWAHYNHPYTSNILNTPEQDPDAFRKSSPIYYAENLEDHLLMLHGMEDDNVQYQDVVRLSQRFIELGKKNWNLVGYPIERHGFQTTSSWTDEYRRILELFDQHLLHQ